MYGLAEAGSSRWKEYHEEKVSEISDRYYSYTALECLANLRG